MTPESLTAAFWVAVILADYLLAAGALLTQLDFDVVWRYFSWANQSLAMIALWAAAVYLRENGGRLPSLMAALPAAFMSAVASTCILMADEGFRLAQGIAYPVGIVFALACAGIFLFRCLRRSDRGERA